jgi:hypothetical protein
VSNFVDMVAMHLSTIDDARYIAPKYNYLTVGGKIWHVDIGLG